VLCATKPEDSDCHNAQTLHSAMARDERLETGMPIMFGME